MTDKVIVGIHSWKGNSKGSSAEYLDGHAWITVTQNGQTVSYGLYPDGHAYVKDNGAQSDIRFNVENTHGYQAHASSYIELTDKEVIKLQAALKENVGWTYTNTCASWASEVVDRVTGLDFDADDIGGFETPKELADSIKDMEKTRQTSISNPLKPEERKHSFLFGANDAQEKDLNNVTQSKLTGLDLASADQTLTPRDSAHPDNAHFVSALDTLTAFNHRKGIPDGEHTINAAAGILVESVAIGNTKVEGVFAKDGQFNFAQMQNGILKTGSVDIAVATTPAELSFAKLPQAHEQHAQTLALDEAPKRNKQHSSPSMS